MRYSEGFFSLARWGWGAGCFLRGEIGGAGESVSSLGEVFGVFARGGFRSVFARRGSWCLRSAREGAEKSSARESVSSLGEGVGVFAREGGSRSSLGEGKVFGEELVLCPALVKNNNVLP